MNNGFGLRKAILLLGAVIVASGSYSSAVNAADSGRQVKATAWKEGTAVSTDSNVSALSPGYVHRFANEPIMLTGVDRSYDVYYNVPKAELGGNHYLELDLSYSDLLLPSQSTLTVLVDNKPLKSVSLTKEEAKQRKVTIALGPDEAKPGFHKLTFAKHGVVSDDFCEDPDNPANWLQIARSSFVYIDSKATWTTADPLKEFPHPFIEPGTTDEVYGTIVVPDAPSPELLSSALELAARLSSLTAAKKPVPMMTESEWAKADGKSAHVIAMGSVGAWTGPVKKIVEENGVRAENEELALDYMSLEEAGKTGSKQMLLLSAAKDEAITEKLRVLTSPKLAEQLTGSHLVIRQTPAVADDGDEPKKLTLASFGSEHLLLNETKPESGKLNVGVPSYWKLTGESSLELKLKVSPLLMAEIGERTERKSTKKTKETGADRYGKYGLTVTVNGIPKTVSLQELTKTKHQGDTYTASIPLTNALQDKDGSGVLDITFTANIGHTEGPCIRDTNNGRWIFVDKASTFNVPHEMSKDSSFQHWPAPFVSGQGTDRTAILVPQQVNGTFLSQLSRLVGDLTSDTSRRIAVFREPLDDQALKQLKDYHVIVPGDLGQFPSLQKLRDKLLLPTDNDRLQLGKYNAINETTDYAAWIQRSVWNENRVMAVFQKVNVGGGEQGSFVHPNLLQYLKNAKKPGQVVIMNKAKAVFTAASPSDSKTSQDGEVSNPTEKAPGIPVWLMVLIPVLLVGLLIVFIRMRRKEKRDAGKQ
ncbi:cellulose biosynthesis cyclic di-GMP-binding regulatory protein BcsB [Paenibacillus tianmuensis]|nr:cellulose biosynthesis cyclic di-GMP-binding regulatory protein BcsB [Paenibacillus tianmuensis]